MQYIWTISAVECYKRQKAGLGCKGCYQYDPVEYRIQSVRRISEEAVKKNIVQDILVEVYL